MGVDGTECGPTRSASDRRHAVPRTGGLGAADDRSAWDAQPCRDPIPGLPQRHRQCVRRREQASCRRAVAEPLHHPAHELRPVKAGAFIDRYVFPDGELTGSGRIIAAMQDNGLARRPSFPTTFVSTTPSPCANGARTFANTGTPVWARSVSAPHGYGGCTWPHPGWPSNATPYNCTRCWQSDRPTREMPPLDAASALPSRPWWHGENEPSLPRNLRGSRDGDDQPSTTRCDGAARNASLDLTFGYSAIPRGNRIRSVAVRTVAHQHMP